MANENDRVWRDRVRLRATSPEALIAEMTRRRGELQKIVTEQRDPGATLKVEECFDGIWSKLLRKAVRTHGATGIEINALWAMLPQGWVCPCCKRAKAEIVILTEGVLLAKAVDHHDHFTSQINRSFQARLGENWAKQYPGASDLQQAITANFLAFPPVVICESCNQADGEAKKLLRERLHLEKNALEDLSFALDEISSFIDVRHNQKHKLRESDLINFFCKKQKMKVLEFRRQAVNEQIDLFRQGLHWKTKEIYCSAADIYVNAREAASDIGIVQSNNFNIFDYSSTTVIGEMPANTWRRNREWGRKNRIPAVGQVEEFIASREKLSEVGSSWRCPTCNRSLRRIVRYNNRGALFAAIRHVGAKTDPMPVCMDCYEVAEGLAKESQAELEYITIDDVCSVLRAISHARHGLQSDIGTDRVVAGIRERLAATLLTPADPFSGPGFVSIF